MLREHPTTSATVGARCSRRAARPRPARSTPWCRRASARAATTPRATHAIMQRGLRSFGLPVERRGEALPHGSLPTWGPGWGRQTNGTARVPRQQRAQQRRGRGGSVLCGCPPGIWIRAACRDSTQSQSRRTRVFLSTAGARRRGESLGCTGVRGFGSTLKNCARGLSSSAHSSEAAQKTLQQSLQYVAAREPALPKIFAAKAVCPSMCQC